MSKSILISPAGHLRLVDAPDETPALSAAAARKLDQAFSESSAAGLVRLASHELDRELPAALVYWRGLAHRFFQAVCQLGEGAFGKWSTVPPPDEAQLASLVDAAFPMQGLEYLTTDALNRLWVELREFAAEQAKQHPQGHVGYLRDVHPLFHLLGRVTFHLAENKRDSQRPFAFLATFTHGISGKSRLQHLPLAEALKNYAGARDKVKLDSLLEPVQRAAQKSPLVKELLESKALFAPQAWSIGQAYRFLSDSSVLEDAGVVVRVPDWWAGRRPPRPQVQVRIGNQKSSEVGLDQMLDFDVGMALDGVPLTEGEMQQLLAGTEGLMLLRGKWVEVDRTKIEQALDHWRQLEQDNPDGISFIQGMRMLAGAELETEGDADDQAAAWSQVTAGDWMRQTLERMRHPEQVNACQPGRNLNATLRPYQIDGVRWLWFMTELGLGACLADDMGLGKTIQVIDLFLQRRSRHAERDKPDVALASADGNRRLKSTLQDSARSSGEDYTSPNLLVVPASLIGNWKHELARFGPSLRVCFAHRSECDADSLTRLAENPLRELAGFDVVVTTYSLVRREEWFQKIRWSIVALDEAQAIKNASSNQTRRVKKLHAAGRIVLTGTPVENHLGDLWSLFDFCCPGLLGTAGQFKKFVKRLNQEQHSQAFAPLRRLVRPYILRRLKSDRNVIADLPEKTEMRTECGLSKKQAALYEQAVGDLKQRLDKADGMARRGLVLSMLMQLKQICNHPAQLLNKAEFPPAESGKFDRLLSVCEPIVARQEKVLVFTQFQSLTQPLAVYLATVFGRPGLVLHGGTPIKKRSELVRQFQEEQGPPFFVISLKAGGSGLNLTAASHVIHFDRWWNPAVENRATDRAFRIGQKRNVLVHKFVCRGTVEERIDEMIRSKQSLADQLLNQDSEIQLTEMSDDELLRFVALDIGRAADDG